MLSQIRWLLGKLKFLELYYYLFNSLPDDEDFVAQVKEWFVNFVCFDTIIIFYNIIIIRIVYCFVHVFQK